MECTGILPEQPAKVENHRCSARQKLQTLAYIDLGPGNGGTLIDVCECGLSFQGIHRLEIGHVLPISFKLPGTNLPLRATGQIVWLNESENGGGLQFIELQEDTRSLLRGWLSGELPKQLGEQRTASPARVEKEIIHPASVLRAVFRENRPTPKVKLTLADVLHDKSLSRDDVIAAVDATRLAKKLTPSPGSNRAPRLPIHAGATNTSRREFTTPSLRKLLILPMALFILLGVGLVQHYGKQSIPSSSSVSSDSPFGLEVERTGADWRIHWNRNSEVLAKAASGRLSISDGSFQKELDLDTDELRSGSIMYTPATDDVVVRLQVVVENLSEPVSESVRIVAGKLP